ncbi:hypothetical protein CDV55_106362, partial [Aspergillus turcosus]
MLPPDDPTYEEQLHQRNSKESHGVVLHPPPEPNLRRELGRSDLRTPPSSPFLRPHVFLGIITIFPWAALIVFDVLLYIWRMGAYEFPVIGGRARGMQRPRAPTLNVNVGERSEVPRRVFGLGAAVNTGGGGEVGEQVEVKRRERVVTDTDGMSTRFQAYLEPWTFHLERTHPSIILLLVLGIWIFVYWNRKTVPSKHDSPSGEEQGYGYPPITPLPTFNWETTNPLALRPFKPKYHLTM